MDKDNHTIPIRLHCVCAAGLFVLVTPLDLPPLHQSRMPFPENPRTQSFTVGLSVSGQPLVSSCKKGGPSITPFSGVFRGVQASCVSSKDVYLLCNSIKENKHLIGTLSCLRFGRPGAGHLRHGASVRHKAHFHWCYFGISFFYVFPFNVKVQRG